MTAATLDAFLGRLAADAAMWADFLALCDCGGRLAGSPYHAASIFADRERLRNPSRRLMVRKGRLSMELHASAAPLPGLGRRLHSEAIAGQRPATGSHWRATRPKFAGNFAGRLTGSSNARLSFWVRARLLCAVKIRVLAGRRVRRA